MLGSWRELHEVLGKSSELLLRNFENLDNALDMLDPQLHSLGFLAVYIAKFTFMKENASDVQAIQGLNPEFLVQQVSQFFNVCNGEQIRFAPDSCEYCWLLFIHIFYSYKCGDFSCSC